MITFERVCPIPTELDSWLDLHGEGYQLEELKWRERRDAGGCGTCANAVVDDRTGAIWCTQEGQFVLDGDAEKYDCPDWSE